MVHFKRMLLVHWAFTCVKVNGLVVQWDISYALIHSKHSKECKSTSKKDMGIDNPSSRKSPKKSFHLARGFNDIQ